MKKTVIGIAMSVLALVGVVVGTSPASAGTIRWVAPAGWGKTTRTTCEQGHLVHMNRLSGPYGTHQGRLYIYVHNNRLCAFAVDHLAGSHTINLEVRTAPNGTWGQDIGYYQEYAGAMVAPRNRCMDVSATLQVKHGGSYWLYGGKTLRQCIPQS